MSNIFKFFYNNIKLKKVYVFVGDLLYKSGKSFGELNTIYNSNPSNAIISEIFNTVELENISKNAIEVEFVDDVIYNDDTIEIVKFKLLKYLKAVCFEELYFYGYFKDTFSSDELKNLYHKLTQNNKIHLTKSRLLDYLINIDKSDQLLSNEEDVNKGVVGDVSHTEEGVEEDKKGDQSPTYTYDDLLSMDLNHSLIKKSVGQKFVGSNNDLIYVANPFDVIKYDPILEKLAHDIISTNNKNLLFEEQIVNNTIYFTLFKDVYEYISTKLNVATTIKIYFPYLHTNAINTIENYTLNHQKLLTKTQKIIESVNLSNNLKSVTLFYNLYEAGTLKYNEFGIKTIELNIHPNNKFNFPLDIIFKLLHAEKHIPLIKFNPGKRQENIYRLYSETRSTSGKKIPYLSKALILKLMKLIGNSKRVAIYTITNGIPIIYEFDSFATINVKMNFIECKNLIYIQQLISETLNPILNVLHEKVQQSGYTFNNFTNILSDNIEIVAVNYFADIEIMKNINLTSIKSCVSNVFNITNYKLSDGIEMRYKRVSNYNEMNAIDSTIVELIKLERKESEIINNLVDNYKMSVDDAKIQLVTTINSLQVVQNVFQNKKMKVKNKS
mgnify:FL=1